MKAVLRVFQGVPGRVARCSLEVAEREVRLKAEAAEFAMEVEQERAATEAAAAADTSGALERSAELAAQVRGKAERREGSQCGA